MARADGSPKDVDREFVTQYGLFDETLSWYFPANVERLYTSEYAASSGNGGIVACHAAKRSPRR